jgi:hypothetical protein
MRHGLSREIKKKEEEKNKSWTHEGPSIEKRERS